MPLTRFNINSTPVGGIYGIVDIIANDTTVALDVQLDGNIALYQYDTPSMIVGINSLKVSLKNGQAIDNNGDGDYNDPEDETMKITVSNLAVAIDNVTFVEYLPRPAGNIYDQSGNVIGTVDPLNDFISWGPNFSHTFIIGS
jgi:hypothetical protein